MKYIWLIFAILSLVRVVTMLLKTFSSYTSYSPNLGYLFGGIFAFILFSVLAWRGFRK